MDRKKGMSGKFLAATCKVTAGNLPVLHFCEPPQDKFGLLAVADFLMRLTKA